MNNDISVLLIDDHQLIRAGIKQIIDSSNFFTVIEESSGKTSISELMKEYKPDMVLMDINLRYVKWQDEVKKIKQDFPETVIIILTFNDDESMVIEAIQLGVQGYLLKSMDGDGLIEMMRHIYKGGTYIHHEVAQHVLEDYHRLVKERISRRFAVPYEKPLHILSRRECQVLQLLANGNSNKSIARILGISQSTCKNHVNSILRKMGVNDRTHAVVTAIRNGWVELDSLNKPLSS